MGMEGVPEAWSIARILPLWCRRHTAGHSVDGRKCGDSFAVEYAYGDAAGPGWFGLSVMGQMLWLLPVLHGDVHGHAPVRTWTQLEFPGQVAGTFLVTIGLLIGMALLVALGAAVNLAASVLVMAAACVCGGHNLPWWRDNDGRTRSQTTDRHYDGRPGRYRPRDMPQGIA